MADSPPPPPPPERAATLHHPAGPLAYLGPRQRPPQGVRPIAEPLRVVAVDGRADPPAWAIVDKPPGLLSTPGRGAEHDRLKADCVEARVRELFPDAEGPIVPHRLDMDTSGLMAVGLTPHAHRSISIQFQNRRTHKVYIALLLGHHEHLPEGGRGEIDVPIRLDPERRPFQIHDFVQGKPALTAYTVLERSAVAAQTSAGGVRIAATRVRFEPKTGRSHQLRLHAALPRSLADADNAERPGGLAAPIVGDPLYGTAEAPGLAQRPTLKLHAARLYLQLPGEVRPLAFESDPPF
jgi:tRNA pseudouridine32 synthase/23S rRNA pseudouridine746 synthase